MEQQRSFEDAAFELFKNLCPEKNFKRDEIPYQTVRELVEKHLSNMDPEKRQLLETRMRGEIQQEPSEIDSKVGSRGPSPSKPKSVSEYRNLLVAERHHLLPKLEDFNEAQKIHLRYPKNVRKFVRTRTERRLAAESNDYVNIVCDEKKLPEVFQPIYDQILRKRKKSLQCYHMIINTLHHYFMRITWSDLVWNLVDDFIEKHIILSCDDLTTKYDRQERAANIFERLREYELMVLLELHLIKKYPERIEETEVVNKLGFLVFVADSVHMKNFLDEIVCDLFAHIMPKALVYIYEELCIKIPLDLEDRSADGSIGRIFETRETGRRSSRKMGPGSAAMLALEREAAAKKTERARKHKKRKSNDSSPESISGKSKMGLRARAKQAERISKRIAAREKGKKADENKVVKEEKASESGSSSSSTISEGDDLGEIVVPPTPKSKMKKKLDEKISKDDENVMQTPLSKLNRIPARKNEKLASLLEKSLKNQSQQQSRKRKSLPHGKTQPKKKRNSLPSSLSASNLANGSRARSARINLNERFAVQDRLNEEANACSAITSPALRNVIEDISLDNSIIERYRKRIEAVRHSARKSDKNEVFYGRCTSRHNLFDDSFDEEDSEGVATRSTACIQKNRSGRSVQTSQKVYMAHALLNVYNADPLNPPKLPKDAPFKLHRLIRPASKSDKKRLSKLRLRMAREKSGSSSSLVKNNTSCEILEGSNSSKNVKTRFETVEGNSASGSEKFKVTDKKEILEIDNSQKPVGLTRDSSEKKLYRKLTGTENGETYSGSSSRSSRKSSSKKGSKSSCSSNGVSSSKSEISDSNGLIVSQKSSKISAEIINDVSETLTVPCVIAEESESADIIGNQMRKASCKVTVDKIGKEGERLEKLSGIPFAVREKEDEIDVS